MFSSPSLEDSVIPSGQASTLTRFKTSCVASCSGLLQLTTLIPNAYTKAVAFQFNISRPLRGILYAGSGWWPSSVSEQHLLPHFLIFKNRADHVRHAHIQLKERKGRVPFQIWTDKGCYRNLVSRGLDHSL